VIALPRRRRGPDLQAVLTGVWSEVLGRPVGPADDFFELGGNSLDAVRIVARVEELLGAPVDVGALFETLTPAAMAASLLAPRDARRPR
jgi:acyl carrier protein